MFKKTGIAIALAALATGSFAAEFAVGTDTKFEVNVDVGAYYQSIKDANGTGQSELLGKGLNQVEIKATRTINDDMSVFGEIEIDYDPIKDNGTVLTDDTRVGFASKKLGRFTVGQFDSFFEDNVMEALGVGHGDKGFVTEPNGFKDPRTGGKDYGSGNDGRHLQYSHKIGDLAFAVDLTSNNNSLNTDAGHGAAIAATYQLGAFSVGLGYSDNAKYATDGTKFSGTNGNAVTANLIKNATGLTAAYKFGNTKVIGLVATETTSDAAPLKNVNTNYTGLALTHVMGEFDIGVAFQNRDDSLKTYSEWAIGLGYTPFKNMTFFLDVNGLGFDKGVGDVMEIGAKYTF